MSRIQEITKSWRWPDYGIMLLILVFAIFNKSMPMVMALTALSLIVVRNNPADIKRLLSFKYPFVWFIIFFLVHAVGLINTSNMEFAISDIGMKASLIGVPLFLILSKIKLRFDQIVTGYLAALAIALVFLDLYAVYRSFAAPEDNHWGYFKESDFSILMHRSYFATYLALGTLISVYRFIESNKGKIYHLLLSLLMFAGTIQTFSKAGILILAILMVPLGFYLVAKKYNKWYALIATGSFLLLFVFAIKSIPKLDRRFEQMVSGFVSHQNKGNASVESSASRMIMWSTSMELFSENILIGVGTGDVRDELDQRNVELGNLGVVEESLNSHNQYLNTSVQLGLLGLIPLLLSFLTAIFIAIRRKNLILFMTTVAFMLTMLFESFLETQAGLIPVTLFVLLFTLKAIEDNEEQPKYSEN